ncbi:alpha/beta hydrolase [Streptoalloteichus hindustanus]|uniref:Acetyl esterase/lipase n=1 Tax=Streptoalloteichus hindustanus TaxID=2017 RepID=A0A1M5CQZ2_STRHI|nr:alpha/beta hydrolase [Streptoalloteichus hindustanus]SHF57056.1 Acetyl esterase/lipase [Streptoalloteichus hindustanus]
MKDVTGAERPPLGIRLLHALSNKGPDWATITAEELAAFSDAENRKRSSPFIRVITGLPDRGAEIRWREVALPDRTVRVRVYRPTSARGGGHRALPLVLHVHGGGFVGTAVQSDWVNSHLAARLPAVVVSVEHRLLAPGTPLPAAVDDGWDVLHHVVRQAAEWGIDPARAAVFGESTGGLICALVALRARETGLPLRAQVLVNPALDLTDKSYDYASTTQHAHSPTLNMAQMRLLQRLAAPEGEDPRALSPLHADDLSGLAPALVVVPTVDPLADHGRLYFARLRESGTPAHLTEHPGATHAFLSMPGLVRQAGAARAEVAGFLRGGFRLTGRVPAGPTKTGKR